MSDDVELEVELLGARSDPQALAEEPESRGDHESFSVLVLDDDPDLRRYVRRSLERPGHPETHVVEAGDGAEALRLVASIRLHLVIADVVMPGMDGYGFVREVRRRFPADRLPILVITGHGSWREASSRASRAGAQAVLSKPFNARKLCDLVSQLLGTNPPTASATAAEDVIPEDPPTKE